MAGLSMRQFPVEPSKSTFCPEHVTVNDIRRCIAIAVTPHDRLRPAMNPACMVDDYEFST
jgi:hypothetical protein